MNLKRVVLASAAAAATGCFAYYRLNQGLVAVALGMLLTASIAYIGYEPKEFGRHLADYMRKNAANFFTFWTSQRRTYWWGVLGMVVWGLGLSGYRLLADLPNVSEHSTALTMTSAGLGFVVAFSLLFGLIIWTRRIDKDDEVRGSEDAKNFVMMSVFFSPACLPIVIVAFVLVCFFYYLPKHGVSAILYAVRQAYGHARLVTVVAALIGFCEGCVVNNAAWGPWLAAILGAACGGLICQLSLALNNQAATAS